MQVGWGGRSGGTFAFETSDGPERVIATKTGASTNVQVYWAAK
jgi:hypothetical protein